MSQDVQAISVDIFNKTYNVRCAPGEVEALMASAKELNDYFDKLSTQRNQHSRDQMVMLAALNFVGQLQKLRTEKNPENSVGSDKIQQLCDKIAEKLGSN